MNFLFYGVLLFVDFIFIFPRSMLFFSAESEYSIWRNKSSADRLSEIAAEIRSNPVMFPTPEASADQQPPDLDLANLDPEEQLTLAIELSKRSCPAPMSKEVTSNNY